MPAGVRQVLVVARGLLSDLELEVVLERVVDVAGDVSGGRYVPLGVLDRATHAQARFSAGLDG